VAANRRKRVRTIARAVEHGDEHVIKFADTAADVHARTGNPDALAAPVSTPGHAVVGWPDGKLKDQ
jgi:hypothetical protein